MLTLTSLTAVSPSLCVPFPLPLRNLTPNRQAKITCETILIVTGDQVGAHFEPCFWTYGSMCGV